jgi:hypothetical protein
LITARNERVQRERIWASCEFADGRFAGARHGRSLPPGLGRQ